MRSQLEFGWPHLGLGVHRADLAEWGHFGPGEASLDCVGPIGN